jgi:hypothetical protein
MTGRTSIRFRYALAFVLLFAIICGQAAALSPTHEQHKAQDHGCLICFAGSLPFVEPTAGAPAAPVMAVAWRASSPDIEATRDVRLTLRSSRAPPA